MLQDAPGWVGIGQHTDDCRARIEQEMLDRGDALTPETCGNQEEIVKELDVRLKRGTWVSQMSTQALRQAQRQTHQKKGESEHESSAESKNMLAVCIAAVNEILCDTPSVDLSQDRTAQSGKFPENELKAGREVELRNMLNFDALASLEELPQENTPTTWFGSVRGEATE